MDQLDFGESDFLYSSWSSYPLGLMMMLIYLTNCWNVI